MGWGGVGQRAARAAGHVTARAVASQRKDGRKAGRDTGAISDERWEGGTLKEEEQNGRSAKAWRHAWSDAPNRGRRHARALRQ